MNDVRVQVSNCNGFGDMWWTDKCTYFSSIDNALVTVSVGRRPLSEPAWCEEASSEQRVAVTVIKHEDAEVRWFFCWGKTNDGKSTVKRYANALCATRKRCSKRGVLRRIHSLHAAPNSHADK